MVKVQVPLRQAEPCRIIDLKGVDEQCLGIDQGTPDPLPCGSGNHETIRVVNLWPKIIHDSGVGVFTVVEHARHGGDTELCDRFTEKQREFDIDDGFFSRMDDEMIGSGNAGAVQ